MSATDHHHGHASDGHDGDALPAHMHVSLRGYATGFVLSVVLTAIPFWLIMGKVIANPGMAAAVILAFAAVQMVVHMVYFLHMNTRVEGGWSMLALVFTLVLVIITLAGSIWVMYHLNTNMMPGMAPDGSHQMHQMP